MNVILPYDEWIKVGKGLLVAAVGAALTYLTAWITSYDFGQLTPAVVAVWSVIANYIRKVVFGTDAPPVTIGTRSRFLFAFVIAMLLSSSAAMATDYYGRPQQFRSQQFRSRGFYSQRAPRAVYVRPYYYPRTFAPRPIYAAPRVFRVWYRVDAFAPWQLYHTCRSFSVAQQYADQLGLQGYSCAIN